MKNLNILNSKRNREGEKFLFNILGDNKKGVFRYNLENNIYHVVAIAGVNSDKIIIASKHCRPNARVINIILKDLLYPKEIKNVKIDKESKNPNIVFLKN